jgi:hypothetical protein
MPETAPEAARAPAGAHWLTTVCDPEPKGLDGLDGLYTRPWVLHWRGRPCVVATDGRLLVLAPHDFPAEAPPPPVRERLLRLLDAPDPPAALETTAEALAAWCGPRDPGEPRPCDQCGGSGLCHCPRCDAEHDCGFCDGGEAAARPPVRPGVLAGVVVDRNRLALALPHLSGPCTVRGDAGRGLVGLDARGWRVLAASLGWNLGWTRGGETGPEFPAGEGASP